MNPSKARSSRQWLIWINSGAVRLHDNPAINRTLLRFARTKLQKPETEVPDCSITPAQTGDLVIHVPADGSRGSGPLYVDNGDKWGYGGDGTRLAVSVLVFGPAAWTFGLPRSEAVVVGHFDVDYSERYGNAFSPDVLERMRPVVNEARNHFFEWFPTFANGETEILLSKMRPYDVRSAFIADDTASELVPGDWGRPGAVPDQTAYAVPRAGYRTYVEVTAHRGKFLLRAPDARRGNYVIVQNG